MPGGPNRRQAGLLLGPPGSAISRRAAYRDHQWGFDAVLREALHMTFPDLAKSR
jgi:hypothetical protein